MEFLRKISSRKLWAAGAGLIAGLAMVFGLDESRWARWSRTSPPRGALTQRASKKLPRPSKRQLTSWKNKRKKRLTYTVY